MDRIVVFGYPWAVAFWLFQEKQTPDHALERLPLTAKGEDFQRIRCPSCGWKPNASSRWFCGNCDYPEYFYDGCGTAWNTFTTRGLCPGCAHQWRWTICLRCCGWSRHEAWYQKKKD
ncbi:MAG TPA: hypothetical protein VE131_00845 [Terriglobales bacterium]|nr:hypothetical protein [Terriglobales bacterium]